MEAPHSGNGHGLETRHTEGALPPSAAGGGGQGTQCDAVGKGGITAGKGGNEAQAHTNWDFFRIVRKVIFPPELGIAKLIDHPEHPGWEITANSSEMPAWEFMG